MENKDQNDKQDKTVDQKSAYQELYGKKEGEDQEGNPNGTKPIDSAGAFGSAAGKPGTESRGGAEDRIQSGDESREDD